MSSFLDASHREDGQRMKSNQTCKTRSRTSEGLVTGCGMRSSSSGDCAFENHTFRNKFKQYPATLIKECISGTHIYIPDTNKYKFKPRKSLPFTHPPPFLCPPIRTSIQFSGPITAVSHGPVYGDWPRVGVDGLWWNPGDGGRGRIKKIHRRSPEQKESEEHRHE